MSDPVAAPMISVAEARARLLALIEPVGAETVSLLDAAGRVLRAPIVARRTQPPFAASAMDGYAVRAGDLAEPGATLRLVGAAPAGAVPEAPLGPGETVRIFTGAPLPRGADAVLLQEDARLDGPAEAPRVAAATPPEPGAWVRPAGGDFHEGATLATAPRRLSPEDVALAAAAGHAWLTVSRRPRVAVLALGDELALPGDPLGPAAIVSTNNFGLAALIREAGGAPVFCPIVPDDPAALGAAIAEARGCDLIATLGGASDGAHDLARPAFKAAGATLDFYRIAMRPGKPLSAARFPGAGPAAIGLPGNPVSAMVCARLFLTPAIAAAAGLPPEPPATVRLPLAEAMPANGVREHYARGRLVDGPDGPAAAPADDQDSSLLSRLSAADLLILRPPSTPASPAGALVDCLILRSEAWPAAISSVNRRLDTKWERG